MTRLGRRTGPKPGFTQQEVLDAALELGLAHFTLADVAARLGVKSPALYRVISSREDVLRSCLQYIAERATQPAYPPDWPGMLRDFSDWLWELMENHPGLAETLMTVPWAHQVFGPAMNHCLAELTARGLGREQAFLAMDFVADTVVSMHMVAEIMRAPRTETERTWPSGLAAAQERFTQDAAGLPSELYPDAMWLGRGFLDRKIDLIIAGLVARLQQPLGSSSLPLSQPNAQGD